MSGETMSCEQVQQRLLDSLADGAAVRSPELAAHLEQCSTCRAALLSYEQLGAALAPGVDEAGVVPHGGWPAFQQRLLQGAAGYFVTRTQRPQRRHALGMGMALGMAASILLFGAAFWLGYRAGNRPGEPTPLAVAPPQAAPFARLASADVNRQVEAFEQVSEVFDRRASWVMTSDVASDMGLAPQPIAGDARILLLRLAMVRGEKVVSRTDLAIVPGQSADLTVPLEQGRKLHYQIGTTTDEPPRLSLWVELQTPAGGETLAALATQLDAEPGQPISAGRLTTAAGVYELQVDFARAGSRNAPRPTPAPPATAHGETRS